MKKYPQVRIVVQGGGSGKGIASLINGTTDLGNASRDMTQEEKDKAKQQSGKDVVEHIVGMDALAIYVHKTNPLEVISIEELAGIYGKEGETRQWTQLTGAAAAK